MSISVYVSDDILFSTPLNITHAFGYRGVVYSATCALILSSQVKLTFTIRANEECKEFDCTSYLSVGECSIRDIDDLLASIAKTLSTNLSSMIRIPVVVRYRKDFILRIVYYLINEQYHDIIYTARWSTEERPYYIRFNDHSFEYYMFVGEDDNYDDERIYVNCN